MFRRRHSSAEVGLPTTTASGGGVFSSNANASNKRPSLLPLRPSANDGSASSIRLSKPLSVMWKQASTGTKATYISFFVFLFLLYLGIRSIRHHNAHVHLDCQSTDCRLSLLPVGVGRKKIILNFPRRQMIDNYPVKTTIDGKVVKINPSLDDDMVHRKRKGPGKTPQYKGPDKNGHYLSYAIVLQQPGSNSDKNKQEAEQSGDDNDQAELVDLSALHPFAEILDGGELRMAFRQFRIGQTSRRVRTMNNRIDSYIKKRRQRVLVKENGVPSWQGILLITLGTVGFLLTLLIGQFVDEPEHGHYQGPGARRRSSQESAAERRRRFSADPMARATPARYEVKMKPTPAAQVNRPRSTAKASSSARSSSMTASTTTRRKSTASTATRKTAY